MESKDTPTKEQEQSKLINSDKLQNLKSDYFIQKFFFYIQKRRTLKTIRYNKSIQKKNKYKYYSLQRIFRKIFINRNRNKTYGK